MFYQPRKGIFLFLLSLVIAMSAQANVLCIANDHIAVEQTPQSCSKYQDDPNQTCVDIILFDVLVFKNGLNKPGVSFNFQNVSNIVYTIVEGPKKHESDFYPHVLVQYPELVFREEALLSRKSIVLLT